MYSNLIVHVRYYSWAKRDEVCAPQRPDCAVVEESEEEEETARRNMICGGADSYTEHRCFSSVR
jgi:hypothetical protein